MFLLKKRVYTIILYSLDHGQKKNFNQVLIHNVYQKSLSVIYKIFDVNNFNLIF